MQHYTVKAVNDTDLPEGTDWAFARVQEDIYLFVKRSRFAYPETLCAVLSRAGTARMALLG